jgi:hypothetical protein
MTNFMANNRHAKSHSIRKLYKFFSAHKSAELARTNFDGKIGGKNVNGKRYDDFTQSLFMLSKPKSSKLYVISNVKTHDFSLRDSAEWSGVEFG